MVTWPHHFHDRHPLSRVRTVSVVTAPDPLVTAQEMNTRLRLDLSFDSPISAEDQAVIDDLEILIAAATSNVDGPNGSLGRALGPQTLCLSVQTCGEAFIELPCPPLIAVDSIEYDDSDGATQTLASTSWRVRRGAVYFPAGAPASEDMRITFRAGYARGDSPDVENVPAALKQAIRLMVGDMWAFRESVALGQVNEIPSSTTVKNLLAPFRIMAA